MEFVLGWRSRYPLKAIALIIFAVYIAFCATLYLAGNDRKFSDPFVAVAGNTTPPQPDASPTPEASKTPAGNGTKVAAPGNARQTSAGKNTPAKSK
jgi:hypothetical protein